MIDLKISVPTNYSSLSSAYLAKSDTAQAYDILKKGRELFPSDANLLTEETNLYMSTGKTKEALANLKLASDRDPKNAFYYIFMGNLYDNMANPKDHAGKDLPKPANFEELFKNAESNYLKAIELKPTNKDFLFDVLFNLGAMYNNYGGMLASRKADKITDLMRVQKENEAAAAVYYKKAIPYLEQSLEIRKDERQAMRALRILYLKTGNEPKAKEMSDRLQALDGK
jgi:tetratricopeptide (TPR) repeat protein